jgi:phasin
MSEQERPFKGSSVMTETTTATIKAKAGNIGASPIEKLKHAMPKFGSMEVPAAFREMADKGLAHARETYEKARVTTGEAMDHLKDTFTNASKGATDYNLKVIEIADTNANTAFDDAHELSGVKSLSEFVELSTAHARKRFEAMTAQTKELTELAQKVTTDIAVKDWRHGDSKASN